jgi:pimeloyl-ACP methyl ester carboxylesterase
MSIIAHLDSSDSQYCLPSLSNLWAKGWSTSCRPLLIFIHMLATPAVRVAPGPFGQLFDCRCIIPLDCGPQWRACFRFPVAMHLWSSWQGYGLRMVGHSLGGGTAALTTVLLRDHPQLLGIPRDAISAVCFSAPACLSRDLAAWSSDFVTTLVLQDDAVPRASARAMDRLRQEVEQTDG